MTDLKTLKNPPAVVSKRNDFYCADELVEDVLPYFTAGIDPREFLLRYTEGVIRRVAHAFATGAERGVEQTAELLCDPEFYETRRKRRAKWRSDMRVQQAKQEAEQLEREKCPTAEQLKNMVVFAKQQIQYHETQLLGYHQQLERLKKLTPKNIRLVPKT